jgi:hypothetical protein
MPKSCGGMKSKSMRRKLWATNPKLAAKVEKKTPPGRKLPEKKKSKK